MPEIEFEESLTFIWRGFWRLSTCRPWVSGMAISPMPIPWDKTQEWCDYRGFDAETTELFDHCIQAMDKVFIEYHAQQAKQQAQSANG